jgi:7,8-dihydropterin-6-yl-methyl-4-(beta-D-ribofuranosyl)aminobenzene 5'-phosphate synthase
MTEHAARRPELLGEVAEAVVHVKAAHQAGEQRFRLITVRRCRMDRRQFLRLGAVTSGMFALGGVGRGDRGTATAQTVAVPVVDRLVMTNVVDNIYDIFAKAGKLDTVTVERALFSFGVETPLAEFGLAYHLESMRGAERREVLLDFSLTEKNLSHNFAVLKLDPTRADALLLSHGHADHYGGLADYARLSQGKTKPGLTLYAGGEDTFCHRVAMTPTGGTRDLGQLDLSGLEARGLKIVLAKQPPARRHISAPRRSRRNRARWWPTTSKASTPPATT